MRSPLQVLKERLNKKFAKFTFFSIYFKTIHQRSCLHTCYWRPTNSFHCTCQDCERAEHNNNTRKVIYSSHFHPILIKCNKVIANYVIHISMGSNHAHYQVLSGSLKTLMRIPCDLKIHRSNGRTLKK